MRGNDGVSTKSKRAIKVFAVPTWMIGISSITV